MVCTYRVGRPGLDETANPLSRYRFVDFYTAGYGLDGGVLPVSLASSKATSTGSRCLGVALGNYDRTQQRPINVRVDGIAPVIAAETITPGDAVVASAGTSTVGQAALAANNTGKVVEGKALTYATAGSIVYVRLGG